MSDVPPHPVPDLHSIFGMNVPDAEPIERERPVSSEISSPVGEQEGFETDEHDAPFAVDRILAPSSVEEEEVEPVVELDEDSDPGSLGSAETAVEIERGERQPGIVPQGGEWTGVTMPSRRGSSPRFLTDVIVDMGLVSRAAVEDALEVSRGSGITPERVLL